MGLNDFSIVGNELSDVIGVSSLKGGPMENLGVSITLLEPLDAIFLSPQGLFLGFPFF